MASPGHDKWTPCNLLCFSSFAVYKDEKTPSPYVEPTSGPAALPDHIYMDAMGFGMGCSCLQMTFQAVNICEARQLYDLLTPLTPILVSPNIVWTQGWS